MLTTCLTFLFCLYGLLYVLVTISDLDPQHYYEVLDFNPAFGVRSSTLDLQNAYEEKVQYLQAQVVEFACTVDSASENKCEIIQRQIRELNQAVFVLGNPTRKAHYDQGQPDYYATLGLVEPEPDSPQTKKELLIEEAYLALSKDVQASLLALDCAGGQQQQCHFYEQREVELREAYSVLLDQQNRELYLQHRVKK